MEDVKKEAKDAPQSPRAAHGGDVCDSTACITVSNTRSGPSKRHSSSRTSRKLDVFLRDEPTPSVVKILDFDGKQYYIESSDGKGDPGHLRAWATGSRTSAFLSVRDLGERTGTGPSSATGYPTAIISSSGSSTPRPSRRSRTMRPA
jgi:hypothetical protein